MAKSIYRYRALGRLPNQETDYRELATLEAYQLYFCSPTTYNDPNEFRFNHAAQDNELTNQRVMDLKSKIDRLVRSLTLTCSFSINGDNRSMWHMYADGLKGFCVEYDFETLSLNGNPIDGTVFSGVDVTYSEDIPIIDLVTAFKNWKENSLDMSQFFLPILANKSTLWHKENEFRLIYPTKDSDGERVSHNKEAIRSIICGQFAEPIVRSRMEKFAELLAIPLKTASLCSDSYDIKVD